MRERHNWATGKHPKTCTCSVCQQRRAEALLPRPKKKRKPKSQRGKGRKESQDTGESPAIAEALDILNLSQPGDDANEPRPEKESDDD